MGWVDGWVDDEYDQPQPIGTPRAADIPEEAFSSAAGEGGPQPVAALLRSLLGGDRKVGTTTIGKGGGRGKGAAPRAATRSSPQPQQRAGDRAGTAGGPRRRSSVAITTTTTTTTSTSSSPTAQDAPAPLTLAAPTVVVPNSSFAAAAAGVTTEFHDVVVDVADEGSDDAFDNHLSAEERKGRQRRKKQQHGSYDTRSYGDDDDYGDDDGWGSGSGSAYSDSYSRNTVRNEAVNVTEEHAMRLAWLQGPVEALLTARLTSRPTVIDSQGRLVVPSRKGGGILEGGVHPSHLRGSGGKGGGASRPQSAGGNGSRGGRQPLLRPDGTAYFENVPSMVRREEDKMERLLMELGEHDPALLEQIHRKLMSTNPAYASAADVASGGGPSGRPLSALSAASSRPIHTVRGVPSSLAFASPIRRPNPSHDVSGVDTGGYHHHHGGEGRDMIGDSEGGGIAATVAARAANTSAKPFAETRPGPNRLMFNNSRPMSAAALRGAPPRQAAWPEGTDDEESEEERAAAPNRRMNRPASANAAVGRGGGGGASSLHTSTNASALGAEGRFVERLRAKRDGDRQRAEAAARHEARLLSGGGSSSIANAKKASSRPSSALSHRSGVGGGGGARAAWDDSTFAPPSLAAARQQASRRDSSTARAAANGSSASAASTGVVSASISSEPRRMQMLRSYGLGGRSGSAAMGRPSTAPLRRPPPSSTATGGGSRGEKDKNGGVKSSGGVSAPVGGTLFQQPRPLSARQRQQQNTSSAKQRHGDSSSSSAHEAVGGTSAAGGGSGAASRYISQGTVTYRHIPALGKGMLAKAGGGGKKAANKSNSSSSCTYSSFEELRAAVIASAPPMPPGHSLDRIEIILSGGGGGGSDASAVAVPLTSETFALVPSVCSFALVTRGPSASVSLSSSS